jgi:hypothetical protein
MGSNEIRRRIRERHAHRIHPKQPLKVEQYTPSHHGLDKTKTSEWQSAQAHFPSSHISKQGNFFERAFSLTADTSASTDEYRVNRSQALIGEESTMRYNSFQAPRRFGNPDILDVSQDSLPAGAARGRPFSHTSVAGSPSLQFQHIPRIPADRNNLSIALSNSVPMAPASEFLIPLGSLPNESFEFSVIGADISRITNRTFDFDDDMPDDERHASSL